MRVALVGLFDRGNANPAISAIASGATLRQILFLLKTAPFVSPFRDCFVSHSVRIIDGHHRMSEPVLKNNCQYKKTTNSSKLFQFALMKVAWQPIHSI